MTKRKDRKDAAAVRLGQKGGKARLLTMTAEQRSASARNAVNARYNKSSAQPKWFGVVVVPLPENFSGGTPALAKILDESNAQPNVILWSRDREKARARAREVNTDDQTTGFAVLIEEDYDPARLTIQREFKPDAEAQLAALKVVIGEGGQL
jgi:hypothetical protein